MQNLCMVNETRPVPPHMKAGFDSIQVTDIEAYLKFLSSDLMEGRDTGERGFKLASEFVAAMFHKWGIAPAGDPVSRREGNSFFSPQPAEQKEPGRSYFQNLVLKEYTDNESLIRMTRRQEQQTKSCTFHQGSGYSAFSRDNIELSAPVVFVGYGLRERSLGFNEYRGVNVKGKYVLMLSGVPRKDDPDCPFKKGDLKKKYFPERRRRGFSKRELAAEMGALGTIIVDPSVMEKDVEPGLPDDGKAIIPEKHRSMGLVNPQGNMPWNRILTITVSREIADKLFSFAGRDRRKLQTEIDRELKPRSFEMKEVVFDFRNRVKYKLVRTRNVLGYVEGSDPDLKSEVVVIGAHLDHLGRRGDYIYNGADDNGSGSVGVMELAEAFAVNSPRPRRSILFALWTGEEKGLLGSRYYVRHPSFPLNKTVSCLNLDMISRPYSKPGLTRMARRMFQIENTEQILKKIDIQRFIAPSVDENASDLYRYMREANQHVGMHLYIRKSKGGMGGSDYAPFSMKKIPWVFFMAGFTRDYHQPTDSFEKVSTRMIQSVTRLTYITGFYHADRPAGQ